MDRALKLLFDQCAGSPACESSHPALERTFNETVTSLRKDPYSLQYKGKPFTINAQDYVLMILYSMYGRQSLSNLPNLIESVKKGNDAALVQAIGTVRGTLDVINGAMYMSVAAYEELPFSGLADIQQDLTDNPNLSPGPALFMSDPYLLADWHPYRATETENSPVGSDHPILLISGRLDPVTPPENARSMLPHLTNATHIIFENESHANFDPCYFHLLIQFFNDPTAELSDCYKNENPLTLN
jgi:pimeloyl-ACP methyl ester carboxylesterase